MTNRLAEKVCIITGTGGGMGREAALIFARGGALIVGCGLYVEDAEATVAAVRALQPASPNLAILREKDRRTPAIADSRIPRSHLDEPTT